MMMADDLKAIVSLVQAMPVMKMKPVAFPRVEAGALEPAIVIACDQDDLARRPQTVYQRSKLVFGCAIVHKVAQQNQANGIVVSQQLQQTLLDGLHSPERKKISGGALA